MFWDFIRAFYSSWGKGVTGTASAPLFVAALFLNGVPRIISAALGFLCFLSASYLVWADERRRVVQVQGRPEVSLNILRMGNALDGEWFFRLTNSSDNTAMNVTLTPVTDGIVRYEFDSIPSIVKSPAPSNMNYRAIVPLSPPLPSIPLPGNNRDMVRVLGLGKAGGTETYGTSLKFSNYGSDSTWQIEYLLECNFENNTMKCIAGACRKVR
jgi:hypothetical protein